jgi:hypothetical protein
MNGKACWSSRKPWTRRSASSLGKGGEDEGSLKRQTDFQTCRYGRARSLQQARSKVDMPSSCMVPYSCFLD